MSNDCFKLHISVFLFNEKHYGLIVSLISGKLLIFMIYKMINMKRICWVNNKWIVTKLHKCVFCTIIQSYRYEWYLRKFFFRLMETYMYLVYTSTRYCPFKYKKNELKKICWFLKSLDSILYILKMCSKKSIKYLIALFFQNYLDRPAALWVRNLDLESCFKNRPSIITIPFKCSTYP